MTTITPTETVPETVQQLPIEAIVPDPANRKVVLDAQFVASVRTHGVLQPLLVTPHAEGEGRFHLVAGHRRLAAVISASWTLATAKSRTDTSSTAVRKERNDSRQVLSREPTDVAAGEV